MKQATMTLRTTRFNSEGEAMFAINCPTRGEMVLCLNVISPGGSPVAIIEEVGPPPEEKIEPEPVGVEKVRRTMEENRIPDQSWSIEDVRHFCIVNSIKHGEMMTMDDLLTLCKAWEKVPNKRPPNYNRGLQPGMRK